MLAAGASLGPYKILAPLGAGGMGEVYRAHDTRLGRDVAVKVLPSHLATTPEVRARFEREARTISQLNHPHICTLYDVGHQEDVDYLVMELLEGETLARRLEKGALPSAELLRLAIEMTGALDSAHRGGVVHRDLKPGNVMLTSAGAKLLDFGLARSSVPGRGPSTLSESPTMSRPLTAEGTIVGTFQYMAPELLEGGEADARSDLWALGCVLYEMATGKKAFEAKSQASLIAAIMDRDPPPLSTLAPLAPPALDRLVRRCLAKDPEQRWQTARDLGHELEWIQEDSSGKAASAVDPVASPPRTRENRFRNRPWIVAGSVLVLAGAALLFFAKGPPRLNPAMTMRPLRLPFVEISYPGMSSDGRWIALPANDGQRGWGLYFMNLGGGEPRQIVSADPATAIDYADVSPDGSWIAYHTIADGEGRNQILAVPSLGGESRVLAERAVEPHWTPDGQRLGYQQTGATSGSGRQEFWSVRPDGSDRRLEFIDSLSTGTNRFTFAWSPDGKQIVWTRSFDGERYQELVVRTLANGTERQLTHDRAIIDEAWWTRQNDIVFSSNRGGNSNLWVLHASGGPAAQITKGTGPDIGVRVSADGKTLLCLQQQAFASNLWIGDLETGRATQVTHDDRPLTFPALSPDRTQILVPVLEPDPLRGAGAIEVMNRQGSGRRTLLSDLIMPRGAAWSPNGRSIAFCASSSSRSFDSVAVFVADASGAGSRRVGTGWIAEWLDDSTLIARTSRKSRVISARDGTVLSVSADSTFEHPAPDGGVLVKDLRLGRQGWWLRDGRSSSPPRLLVPLSAHPAAIARDGSFMLCISEAGKAVRLHVPSGRMEPVPGTFPGLTAAAGLGDTPWLRLSADGREFVYLRPAVSAKLVLIENLR